MLKADPVWVGLGGLSGCVGNMPPSTRGIRNKCAGRTTKQPQNASICLPKRPCRSDAHSTFAGKTGLRTARVEA